MGSIEIWEVSPGDDRGIDIATAVEADMAEEWGPGDPPPSRTTVATSLFAETPVRSKRSWVATLEGTPAGYAVVGYPLDDANRAFVEFSELHVLRDQRRQGAGRALVRAALTASQTMGRTTVLAWAWTESGRAFAGTHLGLAEVQQERCSRLQVADLDEAQQGAWIDAAPAAREGYRLVVLPDRCPDEHLAALTEAERAMHDMPFDDLDWRPPEPDEKVIRAREDNWQEQGTIPIRSLALAPDGSGAGLSEIFVPAERPQLAWQGDTGVVASHRGKALGRWLKAGNLAAARARCPEIGVVETFNAESNPWMLAINVEMGFRPHRTAWAHQGELATALAAVGG